MCTSPLFLHRPNLGFSFEVPCNNCLECRSASQDSWVFRLGCDLEALYRNKGFAVFLTFTYNNKFLPHSDFGFIKEHEVPCFSSDHVSSFLNKVKVYMHRTYGKGSFKYFLCSEYGKFTKRPHYHALFMLRKDVDFYAFCEKCRSYWHCGFMFPRCQKGYYVDNFGKSTTPLLHSPQHACSYVCKYITKDMDYYALPLIKKYLEHRNVLPKNVKAMFNKRLPHHFQSKGIGQSFFAHCDSPDSLLSCINNGVSNPTNKRIVEIPRYYVEHFAFNHRVVLRDGHKFVSRELRDEYYDVLKTLHRKVFQSRLGRLHDFIASVNLAVLKQYDYSLSDLKYLQSCLPSLEKIMVSHWVNNLSPKMRWYWYHLDTSFTIDSMVDFRMKLYNLDFDGFPDCYQIVPDVDKLFEIYKNVFLELHNQVLTKRYNEYLIQKKLRLIQKGCL